MYFNRDDPSRLAVLAMAYAAVQLVGMSLYGIVAWERSADAFGVYFGLFGRLAALDWRERALYLRVPLSGVAGIVPVAGTAALVCTAIGTTSFDGVSQGALWTGQDGVAPHLQQRFVTLGFAGEPALEITFTLGLLAMVGLVTGVFRLGILGMRSVGADRGARALARLFAPSLVPIALAYVVACCG